MAVKYTKWPQHLPTPFISRPSEIYPNSDFWCENVPSGNPERDMTWCDLDAGITDCQDTRRDQGCQMVYFQTKNPN
jgi:hypothetical protein